MSNRRFIWFFLTGAAALAVALRMLDEHLQPEAPEERRRVLCDFDSTAAESICVAGEGGAVRLEQDDSGGWTIREPFAAAADRAAVMKLLDALTLNPCTDFRTGGELAALGEKLSDFALAPARRRITIARGALTNAVELGAATASGTEIYARIDGLDGVVTVPAAVAAAVPADVDGFRARELLAADRAAVSQIDVRAAGATTLRLVRQRGEWRLTMPSPGPAEQSVVENLLDGLFAARAASFVLPAAGNPPPPGTAEDGMLPAAALAPYGLTKDAGLSVTLRGESGAAETVVFGQAAGTNAVWALVHNGAAVVKVDEAVAARCRVGGDALRDTRVFPAGAHERIETVSVADGEIVYVLALDDAGKWLLESPVPAPADQERAAAVAAVVANLRRNDVRPPEIGVDIPFDGHSVRAAMTTTAASYPGVMVWRSAFEGTLARFADLRSRTMLEIPAGAVRRLAVKGIDGVEQAVAYDGERKVWEIDRSGNAQTAARRALPDAIARKLKLLEKLESQSVHTIAAGVDLYRNCGLDAPLYVVTVDLAGAAPARRNLLIGQQAGPNSYYATVGGADAVFVISRDAVELLAAPMAE